VLPAGRHYYDPLRLPLGRPRPLPGSDSRLWAGLASRSAWRVDGPQLGPTTGQTHGQPVTLFGHVAAACRSADGSCLRPSPTSGPRRASPVPRTTFWPFNAPYAGEFLGTRSRIRGAFRGLHPFQQARLSVDPPCGGELTTLARASLPLQTGPVARPLAGTSLLRFDDRGLSRRREPRYRGSWHFLGPDSHWLAVLSLSLGCSLSTTPLGFVVGVHPICLGRTGNAPTYPLGRSLHREPCDGT
jgi:hypothetical protein